MSLTIDHVTVWFGGHRALNEVSLAAETSKITSLIGPNGAGKTTLFNVVAGVQRPRVGTVRLDDDDLTRLATHRRAGAGLGRTFQRLELFGALTVRENLRVAARKLDRRQRTNRVDELIERLGLGPVADVRSDTLSTGTGRVVELGRALICEPRVLLLDEPASGQDDEETARFSTLLTQLARDGLTILLVEHDMELVMSISDRIHVLDFGRVIASGDPQAVKADPMVQAAYLGTEVPE